MKLDSDITGIKPIAWITKLCFSSQNGKKHQFNASMWKMKSAENVDSFAENQFKMDIVLEKKLGEKQGLGIP